jgi:hypothetical protein
MERLEATVLRSLEAIGRLGQQHEAQLRAPDAFV